jgi:hypothetical protein
MPNYANGKIYTIRFYNSNEIYIGSTIQPLPDRFRGHKNGNCKAVKNIIDTKYGSDWSVCYYELYENYPCNSREELYKKEGEIIRIFKNDDNYNCVNYNIAGRSHIERCKEYRKNHKEELTEYSKKYYNDNKIELRLKWKEYYNDNKDYHNNRTKKYRGEHKVELIEKDKNRYKNKALSIQTLRKLIC